MFLFVIVKPRFVRLSEATIHQLLRVGYFPYRRTNMGITIFSCIPDKDIRVFHLDRQFFSCIPDKDIRVFYLDQQFLSHTGPNKNHVCLMYRLYRKSSDVGLYSCYVKNDVTLCKLVVNVNIRTAVAGSVDFFKLE